MSFAKILRNLLAFVGALATFGLIESRADGGLNGSRNTWQQESDDGRFVLVMIAPGSAEEELEELSKYTSLYAQERRSEVATIRAHYSQSGLYRNDGSKQPLWTMEFQSDSFDAIVAPDGRHVILYSREWRDTAYQVIAFFDRGAELAFYDVEDLVTAMPSMRWRFLVRQHRSPDAAATLEPKAMTCTFRTEPGESFVFDITTGKLIGQSTPWPLYFASAVGVPLLVIAGLGLGFARYRGRARPRAGGRGSQ